MTGIRNFPVGQNIRETEKQDFAEKIIMMRKKEMPVSYEKIGISKESPVTVSGQKVLLFSKNNRNISVLYQRVPNDRTMRQTGKMIITKNRIVESIRKIFTENRQGSGVSNNKAGMIFEQMGNDKIIYQIMPEREILPEQEMFFDAPEILDLSTETVITENILRETALPKKETVYHQTRLVEQQLHKENQIIRKNLQSLREELEETLERREDESRVMENLVSELQEQNKVVETLKTENKQLQESLEKEHREQIREQKVAELFDNTMSLERMRHGG